MQKKFKDVKHLIYKHIIEPTPFLHQIYLVHKGLTMRTKTVAADIRRFFASAQLSESREAWGRKELIENLIVSFTTFPARAALAEYALFSLVQQTIRPAKIVLYLSEKEFPDRTVPTFFGKYTDFGFEARFVPENYRSYKKIVYALREYPENLIVTADDDIFYRPDWLELLYKTHKAFPKDIIAHRVWNVSFDNKVIAPYKEWHGEKRDVSYLNFSTNGGGTLYPPGSLYKDVCNEKLFLRLCPYADDVWLYVMALLQKTKIRRVPNGHHSLIDFDRVPGLKGKEAPSLMRINVDNNQNDIQLKSVLEHYHLYDNFYERYASNNQT